MLKTIASLFRRDVANMIAFMAAAGVTTFAGAQSLQIPRVQDPEATAWLAELGAAQAAYTSNPAGFPQKPANLQPLTCDMTQQQLNEIAGTLDLPNERPEIRRALIRAWRAMGAEWARASYYYRNVQIGAEGSVCEGSKWTAPEVQLFVTAEYIDDWPISVTTRKVTGLVTFKTVDGKQVGPIKRLYLHRDTQRRWVQPEMAKLMAANDAQNKTGDVLAFTIVPIDREGPAAALSQVIMNGRAHPFFTTTGPVDQNGKYEVKKYILGQLATVESKKDRVGHGAWVVHPHLDTFGTQNARLEGCRKDGANFMASPCDVD